jgi:CheY-like chemotaxis protein
MQKIAIVVDDSRVARITLRKLLLAADFEVIEFGSGEEVLNYLVSAPVLPDIIFMDVMMDGMDGLTATSQLKLNPNLSHIPVVMCTGNDTEEDRQKALAVGAITALSKPPVAEALAEIIASVNASPEVINEPVTTFDEEAFMARVRAEINDQLFEQLENRGRQIAEETGNRLIAEQVLARIDAIQMQLAQQADNSANSTTNIDAEVAQACKVAAEENVSKIAVDTIQQVVSEADLPKQVSDFLANEGEEWLTNQEEELGTQLNAQLDIHIPRITSEYLDANLASMVAPLTPEINQTPQSQLVESLTVEQVEQIISTSLHRYTPTVVQPMIGSEVAKRLAADKQEQDEGTDELGELKQQLAMVKNITLGLSVLVVGLLAVVVTAIL